MNCSAQLKRAMLHSWRLLSGNRDGCPQDHPPGGIHYSRYITVVMQAGQGNGHCSYRVRTECQVRGVNRHKGLQLTTILADNAPFRLRIFFNVPLPTLFSRPWVLCSPGITPTRAPFTSVSLGTVTMVRGTSSMSAWNSDQKKLAGGLHPQRRQSRDGNICRVTRQGWLKSYHVFEESYQFPPSLLC